MSVQAEWENLLKWLDDRHGWNSGDLDVEWKDVPGAGRGLFAKKALQQGTTLLVLPPSCLLHPRNIFSQHPAGLPWQIFPEKVVPAPHSSSNRSASPATAPRARPGLGPRKTSSSHSVPRGDGKRQKAQNHSSQGKSDRETPLNGSVIVETDEKVTNDSLKLTTTQLLTVYLAMYRPSTSGLPNQEARSSPWDPYFRTLPTSFRGWHPLTWLIPDTEDESLLHHDHPTKWPKNKDKLDPQSEVWTWLHTLAKSHLPLGVKEKLEDVLRRYIRDKSRVIDVMRSTTSLASNETVWKNAWEAVTEGDFLWAWLNVNTRTFFLPLDIPSSKSGSSPTTSSSYRPTQKDLDSEQQNHTMAPLLDFANHCHSDYKRRCRAANVALIRKITMGSKKVSKPKIKSRSRSRSHSQDAESPSLGVEGVDPNDHENVSIKTDAKSVADVKWDRRSLRLFVQEPSADDSDSQSAELDFTVQPGEEVFFSYGGHDNETLFTEYGFVPFDPNDQVSTSNEIAANSLKGQEPTGNPHASVPIDTLVTRLLSSTSTQTNTECFDLSDLKSAILSHHGYKDDYTLHSHPAPATPSYRLLPALRLVHAHVKKESLDAYLKDPYYPADSYDDEALAIWLRVVNGEEEPVSLDPDQEQGHKDMDDNVSIECKVRDSLVELCEMVIHGSRHGLDEIRIAVDSRQKALAPGDKLDDSVIDGAEAVKRLWSGQERVAQLVKQSVLAGTAY